MGRRVNRSIKLRSPFFVALAQTLGVIAYCFLVVQIIIGPEGPVFFRFGEFIGPALFLATFVFSASTVGLLIFGYPIFLAFTGEAKRGLQIAATSVILGVLFVFSIAIAININI